MQRRIGYALMAFLLVACHPLIDGPRPFSFQSQASDDFLWGVATAGIQVEGNSDKGIWSDWERRGKTKHPIGAAVDFWNRYDEDFALAQSMGMKAFRISLEWARIEPAPGQYDQAAIRRYRDMIAAMRRRGLEPVVTLFHWNHPTWTEQQRGPNGKTGWENPEMVAHFKAYTRLAATQIGPDVKWWITLNEPNVWTVLSHLIGVLPPGKRGPITYSRAVRNLKSAHASAYQILHEEIPGAMVGANVNQIMYDLGDKQSLPDESQGVLDSWTAPFDYVAFDYYYTFSKVSQLLNAAKPWVLPIKPAGMYDVIMDYHRKFNKPIMIAENGLGTFNGAARADGWTREAALVHHTYHLQRARQAGANVVGYLYWSLTDNWEWGGFDSRFGLFTVDALNDKTLTRYPTPAVGVYKQIAQQGVDEDLFNAYPAPRRHR